MNDTPTAGGSSAWSAGGSGEPDGPSPRLPARVGYDPLTEELPSHLAPERAAAGPVVLLWSAGDAQGWAGRVAVAVASAWAAAGRRVVLADLHLEDPVLHESLGEPNLDGVVDIFLYGASVAHSARQPQGQDFYLIPAGTYTARPEEVYRHPRWAKLVAGFEDANAHLLLFAPLSSAGAEALAPLAGYAVLLAGAAAAPTLGAAAAAQAIIVPAAADAWTEPAADADWENAVTAEPLATYEDPPASRVRHRTAAEPDEVAESALAASDAERDLAEHADAWGAASELRAPPADVDERDSLETTMEFGAPAEQQERDPFDTSVELRPAADAIEERDPFDATLEFGAPGAVDTRPREPLLAQRPQGRRKGRRGGPGALVWALALVALLGVGAIALALLRPELFGRSGAGAPIAAIGDTPVAAAPLAPAPAAAPLGDSLPYAVQIRAYGTYVAARNFADEQRARLGEATFYIVPEMTQGVLYFKVMAGLLPDTLTARQLRARLVEAGAVSAADARDDAPGVWSLIQSRPLAFDLGEFDSHAAATERADSLAELGIPTYPAAVPYSDGSQRWRLYGGAFAEPTHAEDMGQMLEQAGLPARLVARFGNAPNGAS